VTRKRKWLIGSGLGVAILLLVVVVAALWLKHSYIPSQIRSGLADSIGVYWDGELTIDEVDFSFTGPLILRDLRLAGPRGELWVSAKSMTVSFESMPSLSPTIRRIDIDGLELDANCREGRLALPLRQQTAPQGEEGESPVKFDLAALTVEPLRLTVRDDGQVQHAWSELSLRMTSVDGAESPVFDIELAQQTDDEGRDQPLKLTGRLDFATWATDGRLVLHQQIDETQSRALLCLTGGPRQMRATARLDAEVAFTGRLDQPSALLFDGQALLADATLSQAGEVLVSSAAASAQIAGQELTVSDASLATGPLRFELERLMAGLETGVQLRDLAVTDDRGRRWLALARADAQLTDWPAQPLGLRILEVDGLAATLHYSDGRLALPDDLSAAATRPAPPSGPGDAQEPPALPEALERLERFELTRAAISVRGEGDEAHTWPGLSAEVTRADQSLHFLLRQVGDGTEGIRLAGNVDPANWQGQARLVMNRQVGRDESQALLAVAGVREISDLRALLRIDVSASGRFDKPLELEPSGDVELEQASFDVAGTGVGDLRFAAHLEPDELSVRDLRVAVEQSHASADLLRIPLGTRQPVEARGLKLIDAATRQWVQIARLQVGVDHWPSLQPVVRSVELWDVEVLAQMPPAPPQLPQRQQQPQAGDASTARPIDSTAKSRQPTSPLSQSPYLELQRLAVHNLAILIESNGERRAWSDIHASAVAAGDNYRLALRRGDIDSPQHISVHGLVNPETSVVDLAIRTALDFDPAETRFILAAAGVTEVQTVTGTVRGDLCVRGPLNDPPALTVTGSASARNVDVDSPDGPIARSVSTDIEFADTSVTLKDFDGWLGPTRIALDRARVPYVGDDMPAISGLTLGNEAGERWLHVDELRLGLRDWPSAQPVVTSVAADGLWIRPPKANLHTPEPTAPEKTVEAARESPTWQQYVDVETLLVTDAAFASAALDDQGRASILWSGMNFSARRRQGQVYHVSFNQQDDDAGTARLEGLINPYTLETDIAVQLDQAISVDQLAAAMGYWQPPIISEGGGRIDADLVVKGRLDDPLSLNINGVATASDWDLTSKGGIVAENFGLRAVFRGRRLDVRQTDFNSFDGLVNLSFYARGTEEQWVYGGRLQFDKVQLGSVIRTFSEDEPHRSGLVSGRYEISGAGSLDDLRGKGHVFLDDADLTGNNLLVEIFRALGGGIALGDTDAAVVFTQEAAVLTIQSGELATRVAALELVPGGTIDLQSRMLDFYVIGAPIKQLRTVLLDIPIIKQLVDVKDRLIQLQIRGEWTQPPASLIRVTPVTNVREATVSLLKGTAEAGGEIGGAVRGFFGETFEAIKDVGQ
jgi:hypothetical protein